MEGKDLRKAGLKVTLPRLKILEILAGSATRHLSAEDIYRILLESNEDLGLATVYRVLTQFEDAGLVTRFPPSPLSNACRGRRSGEITKCQTLGGAP